MRQCYHIILNRSKWSTYDEDINKCSVISRLSMMGWSTLYLGQFDLVNNFNGQTSDVWRLHTLSKTAAIFWVWRLTSFESGMKSATQFPPCFTPYQANIICNSIHLFMVLWLASFESGILHLTSTWLMTHVWGTLCGFIQYNAQYAVFIVTYITLK